MTANSLQFNKFEIKSNVDGKTVDLRAGASIIQYRESVFMPHVEITAFINDTGNTVPADDGSGVLAKLSYEITDGLTLGVNVSYDEAFETRVSGNIEYRFGSGNATQVEKKKWQTPVIQALTESVKHRDVRVHDANKIQMQPCTGRPVSTTTNVNGKMYHCQSQDYR